MLRFGCSCYMIKNVRAISNARLLYTSLTSKDDEKDSKKESIRKITSKVQVDPLIGETEVDFEESSVKPMSSIAKLLAETPEDNLNTSLSLKEKASLGKKQALSKQGESYGKQLDSQDEKQLDSQDVLRNSSETVCNDSQKEFDIDFSKDLNVLEVGNNVENTVKTQKVFRGSSGPEIDNTWKGKSVIKGVIEESTETESNSELNLELLKQDKKLGDNHELSPSLICIEGQMDVKPVRSSEKLGDISDLMSKKGSLTDKNSSHFQNVSTKPELDDRKTKIEGVIEESTKPESSSELNHELINPNIEFQDNYKLSRLLSRLEDVDGKRFRPSVQLKNMFIQAHRKKKKRQELTNSEEGKRSNKSKNRWAYTNSEEGKHSMKKKNRWEYTNLEEGKHSMRNKNRWEYTNLEEGKRIMKDYIDLEEGKRIMRDHTNLEEGKRTNLFSGFEISSYHEPSLNEIHSNHLLSKWKWRDENKFKRILFDDRQWKYPIDNEQDIDIEEETSFEEHIFLDHYLDQFPDIDPIRNYMQLVITGLKQNPYLSVEEKRKKILWHKDYFDNFSAEDFELTE